jgi:hypothetical protein
MHSSNSLRREVAAFHLDDFSQLDEFTGNRREVTTLDESLEQHRVKKVPLLFGIDVTAKSMPRADETCGGETLQGLPHVRATQAIAHAQVCFRVQQRARLKLTVNDLLRHFAAQTVGLDGGFDDFSCKG